MFKVRATTTGTLGRSPWRSTEVNDWGPIPIDELDIKKAGLDVGYKIPWPELILPYLSTTVGVNVPFSSMPGITVSVAAKPWGDWFALVGVRATPFGDTHFTWTYGFGNWSWHPFTFSIAYYNWGPNKAFTPSFLENGVVTVAWSWLG